MRVPYRLWVYLENRHAGASRRDAWYLARRAISKRLWKALVADYRRNQ